MFVSHAHSTKQMFTKKKKKNLNNALRCLTRQPQPTLLILALTQPSPLNVFSPKKKKWRLKDHIRINALL